MIRCEEVANAGNSFTQSEKLRTYCRANVPLFAPALVAPNELLRTGHEAGYRLHDLGVSAPTIVRKLAVIINPRIIDLNCIALLQIPYAHQKRLFGSRVWDAFGRSGISISEGHVYRV